MGKSYTLVKYGIPEGTLKNLVTQFNKFADDAFVDKRNFNKGKVYDKLDAALVQYIQERRNLYLPVSYLMIQKKALEISTDKEFEASNQWTRNFLKRSKYSLHKRTTQIKQ